MIKSLLLKILHKIKRTAVTSLALIAALSVLSVAIGSIFAGRFTFQYICPVNFIAAAILMFGGVLVEFLPVKLPKSKLIDHSTHGQYFLDERQKKRVRAHFLIYLGLCHLLLTSVIQLLLSMII